jgi:hypothetical protein
VRSRAPAGSGLGEAGDREIRRAAPSTIAGMIRGHKKVGSKPTDVPFALGLPFDNLGEGGNAAEPDIVTRQESIRLSDFTVGFAPGA